MASVPIDLASTLPEPIIAPAEVYTADSTDSSNHEVPEIKLRIAIGGAGQSGILRALCKAFIEFELLRDPTQKRESFAIAWLMSDTSADYNYLASRAADLSITYHHASEAIAIQQGIADRREFAWRDHWLLVDTGNYRRHIRLSFQVSRNSASS